MSIWDGPELACHTKEQLYKVIGLQVVTNEFKLNWKYHP